MEERVDTYERMGGVDASHGQKFEWEMTLLAYLRCHRLYEQFKKDGKSGIKSFSLANNVKDAGTFDDVVVKMEYVHDNNIKNKVIFSQFKHIEEPSKNSESRFKTYLNVLKPLTQLFDSFVKIDSMRIDNNNLPQEQIENNLRIFLDSLELDIEVLFYVNIDMLMCSNFQKYQYITRDSTETDIGKDIFNTANKTEFELQLLEVHANSLSDIENNKTPVFQKVFRVFVNQSEPETFIKRELEQITSSMQEVNDLQAMALDEMKKHFTMENPCRPLTEKSEMIINLRNFLRIKNESINEIDKYRNNLRVYNIFAYEIISELHNLLTQEDRSIICITTKFQDLEKIKMFQYLNALTLDFLFLYLIDEESKQKWISARKSRCYDNVEKVYVISQKLNNFTNKTTKRNEIFLEMVECNDEQVTITEYIEQFSPDTETFILNTKLIFQGEQSDVNSICGDSWRNMFDENMICDVLENKLQEIGKEKLPSLSFYIDRKFRTEILNLEAIEEKATTWEIRDSGYIIFSEKDDLIPGHDASYKEFNNMKDIRVFIDKFEKYEYDAYHLCSFINRELKWIFTFGSRSELTEELFYTENTLLNDTERKITIISDVAGMGKTSTLLSLARQYKRERPSHWIFFMKLQNYLKYLPQIKRVKNAAVQFVGSNLLELNESELRLFTYACNESGKAALFLDAFDEISPDASEALLLLLMELERTKIGKIFVSSRPNYAYDLEKTLLNNCVKFQGFTNDEKERALKGYWMEMLVEDKKIIDEDLLKMRVQKTVKILQPENNILSDLLAIPLQIRMIATIFYEPLIENSEEKFAELFEFNIAGLYQKFITLHAERFCKEKLQLPWDKMKKGQKVKSIEDQLTGAEEFACHTIVPKLLKKNKTDWSNVASELCDNLGIVTQKNPIIFLHTTIAEYLAAKYIVTNKLCNVDYCDVEGRLNFVLIDERFVIVRKFINCLINNSDDIVFEEQHGDIGNNNVKNTPLHVASSEGNIQIMRFLIKRNNDLLNMQNKGKYTPLQYACCSGDSEAVKLLLSYSNCSISNRTVEGETILHGAARKGCVETIRLILERDNSLLYIQDKRGFTPLHFACYYNKIDVVNVFFNQIDGKQLEKIRDKKGNTVLHISSSNNLIEMNKLILQKGDFLLNTQNKKGYTPLHLACQKGKFTVAKHFLDLEDIPLNICSINGDTLCHAAAIGGCVQILQLILQKDKSLVNAVNNERRTPLYHACKYGKIKAVEFLLQLSHCKINICNNVGNTVLHVASTAGYVEIMQLILNRDCSLLNIENENGFSPLHLACMNGKVHAVEFLLGFPNCRTNTIDGKTIFHPIIPTKESVDIMKLLLQSNESLLNMQNEKGVTLLHRACQAGKAEAVEYLLNHPKCLINTCTISGNTILHYAVRSDSADIVHLILKHDASMINKQNNIGLTALQVTGHRTNDEAVKVLLKHPGCSVDVRDAFGNTVLHKASKFGLVENMKLILQHNQSLLNIQNNKGETPLHLASHNGKIQAVRFLLDQPNCLVHFCDNDRDTALQLAQRRGDKQIIDILLKFIKQHENDQYNNAHFE